MSRDFVIVAGFISTSFHFWSYYILPGGEIGVMSFIVLVSGPVCLSEDQNNMPDRRVIGLTVDIGGVRLVSINPTTFQILSICPITAAIYLYYSSS